MYTRDPFVYMYVNIIKNGPIKIEFISMYNQFVKAGAQFVFKILFTILPSQRLT